MIDLGEKGPSRRALLAGLVGAPVAISLAGCGIRLENDAPDLPGLKTQGPPPDRTVLLGSLRSVQGLLRSAEQAPDDASVWLEPVRVAHRAQVTRLVDVISGLGIDVPSAAGSSSPEPSPTGTPAPSSTSSPGPAASTSTTTSTTRRPDAEASRLAKSETTYPAGASERAVWQASDANRTMLVALCASRRAAGSLLSGTAQSRRGTPPRAAAATPIARAIRPAVYGFERIAGRTPLRERDQVAATLRWLSGARTDLNAVVDEPDRLSYDLPVRVTDGASGRRLARILLGDVLTAVAAQTERVAAEDAGSQDWLLRVWAAASADHARWGGPLAPFPGLRT